MKKGCLSDVCDVRFLKGSFHFLSRRSDLKMSDAFLGLQKNNQTGQECSTQKNSSTSSSLVDPEQPDWPAVSNGGHLPVVLHLVADVEGLQLADDGAVLRGDLVLGEVGLQLGHGLQKKRINSSWETERKQKKRECVKRQAISIVI